MRIRTPARGGFTLLEVMIASGILIVVLAATTAALIAFTSRFESSRRTTAVTDDAGLAFRMLSNELRLAGFGAAGGAFRANVGGATQLLAAIRSNPLSNYGVDGQAWASPYAANPAVYPDDSYRLASAVPGVSLSSCAGGNGRLWGACCLPNVPLRPDNVVMVRGDRDARTYLSQAETLWDGSFEVAMNTLPGAWNPQPNDWLLLTNGLHAALVCVSAFAADVPVAGKGTVTAGDKADPAGTCTAGVGAADLFPPGVGLEAGALVARVKAYRYSVARDATGARGMQGDSTFLWWLERRRVNPVTMEPLSPSGEPMVNNILNFQLAYGFDKNGNGQMDDGSTIDADRDGQTADEGGTQDWDWRSAPCPSPAGSAPRWLNCLPPLTNPDAFLKEMKRLRSIRITVVGRTQAAAGCMDSSQQLLLGGGNHLMPFEDEDFPPVLDVIDNARYRTFRGEVTVRNLAVVAL